MKWNKQGAQFQASRRGTSKAHEYYFVTTISAGIFATAKEAREYCEKIDRDALVIEEVTQ